MTFATPPYLSPSDAAPVTFDCRPVPRRVRAAVLAALVALSFAGTTLTSPPVAQASDAAGPTPILQYERLSAEQIAAWFHASQPTGSVYRASVPPETLATYFVEEGRAEGVAGDLAFAQSVLETGWFRWPSHGQVAPTHNNFSGMGACDAGACSIAHFRDARIGVRAQIQHLRAYADPTVTVASLAHPLESPRFRFVVPKGRTATWEQMGRGNWASDPQYGAKILAIHRSMLAFAADNGGVADPRPSTPPAAPRFTDVPAGHTHRAAIERLAQRRVVNGCTETTFCPGAGVTRAQLATILAGALDLPPAVNRFADGSGAHAAGIGALTAAGITRGCETDRFCPNDEVTREQLASMLQRALALPESPAPFDDAQGSVHSGAIGAVHLAGIATGYPDDTFRPGEVVTRGQVATLVDNATR